MKNKNFQNLDRGGHNNFHIQNKKSEKFSRKQIEELKKIYINQIVILM